MQVEGSFLAEELTALILIDLSLTRVCLFICFFSRSRWAFPIECGMCIYWSHCPRDFHFGKESKDDASRQERV